MRGPPLPPPAPDRVLRRLVADLAQAAPDDVQGVLDHLDATHRDEIRALLAAYDGEPAEAKQAPRAEATALVGLSPWLEARARSAGDDPAFAMTPAASAALRACIPGLGEAARATPSSQPPISKRAAGVDTLLARLRGRR
jgi:hypothetical protein